MSSLNDFELIKFYYTSIYFSVAPVLPISEPLLYDVGPGSCRLSWRPATLPSFAPSQSPITYTLFVQELPFKTWRPLVKRIPHTSYYVSGLQPDKEYMFRVQAENQYGSSKPTESVLLPRFKGKIIHSNLYKRSPLITDHPVNKGHF